MTETQVEKNAELFEQVWEQATTRIDQLTPDPAEQKFLKAIVMGGTVAAEAVVGATSASQFWGEGSLAWANEISQLFSFLMLSQCYRWVAERDEPDKTPLPKEVSATKLIYAFNTEPEQSLDDFTHFDDQYNYDLDNKPHIVHTASFILARVCEIAGHKCIAWERVKFPVAELTSLAKKGVILDSEPIRGQDDINVVTDSLSAGLQAMNKFHDETG
ncbi:MAG: hypothetical protein FWH51_06660 [Dehalococcoidia bacterium]|nr:hypothetical protein [Dehalococcoidia bacterium]